MQYKINVKFLSIEKVGEKEKDDVALIRLNGLDKKSKDDSLQLLNYIKEDYDRRIEVINVDNKRNLYFVEFIIFQRKNESDNAFVCAIDKILDKEFNVKPLD